MSGAGMQTVREHWKKMWCRRTGALPQFSYGLVVVHGASPTVRLACGGAYGGGEGESRPHPKHQGRQVANTSACHVCIAQSDMGRPFLNSELIQAPTRHPTRRSKPVLASSTHFQCKCGLVVLCELRCCHGSAPRSATGRTRHGIIITSHPTTRPSARLPIAHARYASPPPRLMDAAAARTDHLRRSLASSVVPS